MLLGKGSTKYQDCQLILEEYLIRMEEIIYVRFKNFINGLDKNILREANKDDESYIKRLIISNIARNIWGNEDYYRVRLKDDKFMIRALTNFN